MRPRGQQRIEAERVKTYWETGRIIHADILKYKERADYGKEVLQKLADDLKVDKTTLNRCVKFARTYASIPMSGRGHQFSWTHYRKLIAVADDQTRNALEKFALKNDWSAQELAARIKEEKGESVETGLKPVSPKKSIDNKPLTPLRGELFTYKLVERPNLAPGVESGLLVDLGFGVYHDPNSVETHRNASLRGLKKDDIIESRPKDDAYKFIKSDRTAKDLFTYAAYVEKVIDGDTIKVRFDLGFNVWTRQILRLRGLDCPEVGTKDGDEARAFVRSFLKESQMIIVRSSVSDKYDRYLADVFIPVFQNSEGILKNTPRAQRTGASLNTPNLQTDIYLNNLLLEMGRAVRMG